MRFVTVTPNAAIDTTYLLDRLVLGEINRVGRVIPQPGGKGNNVARVLAVLGHRPTATGFAGGHTGTALAEGLRAQGVHPAFVEVAGETRVCLTIVEGESGRTTEIREPGAMHSNADADSLVAKLNDLTQAGDTVIVSGSIPPGLSPDVARRLIDAARMAGAFVAFDASGDVLRAGLSAQPHLIKPNLDELNDLIGPVGADPISAVRKDIIGPLLACDALVLLSLGPDGAVLIGRNQVTRAMTPPITPMNTVGCGDALLAGYLDARARRLSDADALAHAVAVGTAAAMQEAVGVVDTTDIERLRTVVCCVTEPPEPLMQGGGPQPHQRPALLPGQSEPEGVFG